MDDTFSAVEKISMLHTYPLGHSHAFRSEALECKNESYQGRTYGTTSGDYSLSY